MDGVGQDVQMPGPEALAKIRTEIDSYNSHRIDVARETLMRGLLYMGTWLLVSIALAWAILVEGGQSKIFGYLLGAILISGYFVYDRALAGRKAYQQNMRDRLLPAVFSFVDNVIYRHGHKPRQIETMPGNEFISRTASTHGDMLAGTYDGLAFTLGETELSVGSGKNRTVNFKGIIVYVNQEQGFPGLLLAAKRPGRFSQVMRDMFSSSRLQEVRSGDVHINASHEFRTDNVEAAQSRIDAMAKALDYLSDVWRDDVTRIAIHYKSSYLLVPSNKDFFELPPIDTPLDFDRHVQPMIRDLLTMLATARMVSKI